MPSLEDVYRKYSEVSKAAQLLETQIGNLLIVHGVVDADLVTNPNLNRASQPVARINRQTLGQLIKNANCAVDSISSLEELLSKALTERNRLAHSFFRQHNFLRNSEEGR